MKRLVCIVLVLTISLFSTIVLAEDSFTLRNGIKFGDTMDNVRAKETAAWDEEDCDEDTLRTNDATAAGFNGVEIIYNFDKLGELEEVIWHLDSTSSSSSSDADYEKLYKAFVTKYGSALGFTNGDCYIYTGAAIENAVLAYSLFEMLGGVGDMRDYAEWDVEYENGEHAKIEIAQYYAGESYSKAKYSITISYNHFTDIDIDNLKKEKQEANEAILSDI